jgi:hypothetical protein
MIIIFGLRRMRKGMGPILLRCSNCGASPLVLFRISTWFALFFIPMIPVSFKHYTACPNCKRLDPVSKEQVESARAQEEAIRAAGQDPAPAVPASTPTLEGAVNEWASVSRPHTASNQAGPPSTALAPSPEPTPPPPLPPAGWFPDPSGSGSQRYWDGQQWTEHRAPSA